MVSFLLTAWKEDKTVGKAIECLVNSKYSWFNGDFELLLVAPDKATYEKALETVRKLDIEDKFRYFKDKCEGKPRALNILFKEAKGDILVLTDGEVFFERGGVRHLVDEFKNNPKLGGVSGRPISLNPRNSFWGYIASMNADAVHSMRVKSEKGERRFFPMSGYMMAVRNLGFEFPEDLYLDDAYLTYDIYGRNFQIGYAPRARVGVKYPSDSKDFLAQKFRSSIGFEQLWKYEIINKDINPRSFGYELSYAMFPLKYAKSLKEFIWSLAYYPIRLYIWVKNRIRRDMALRGRSIRDVYVRTESTK